MNVQILKLAIKFRVIDDVAPEAPLTTNGTVLRRLQYAGNEKLATDRTFDIASPALLPVFPHARARD